MKEIAALYARVSTLQQEQEATIDSQVAALESYAQKEGYALSTGLYFLDRGISGTELARPALDGLRDLAAEGVFQVVLCLSPDRLARQYVHQHVLLAELQRAGVRVLFVSQPVVEDSPQGHLLLSIQGVFSEYERAMIMERLRRGKLYHVRQGQVVTPVPPYGYRYIPISEPNGGRWEPDAAEAEVVRRIYGWYTADQPLTISDVLHRLQGLVGEAPPRGKRWAWSTVQAILKQTAYIGRTYYNRTRVDHAGVGQPRKVGRGLVHRPPQVPRPPEEWIEVAVPPLVPLEMWERAQERLLTQRRFAQRNNWRTFYLLRGLLVCDICGQTLAGRQYGNRITYYCPVRPGGRPPGVPSHRRMIKGALVEPLVWGAVCRLLRNPRLLADAWQSQTTPSAPAGEAERLQAQERQVERQWQRLLDLFQEEQIDKEEFSRRKARLDQRRDGLTQRLQQLSQHSRQQGVEEQMIQDFTAFCQQIEQNLTNPTPEVKQKVMRLLIDHIVVGEREIVIKHIIPTDDDCRLLPGRAQHDINATMTKPWLCVGLGQSRRACHLECKKTGLCYSKRRFFASLSMT